MSISPPPDAADALNEDLPRQAAQAGELLPRPVGNVVKQPGPARDKVSGLSYENGHVCMQKAAITFCMATCDQAF
jgi:hypothetical protein